MRLTSAHPRPIEGKLRSTQQHVLPPHRPGPALPPLTWEAYTRLNQRLHAAIASPHVRDKLRFLHQDYNRQIAPRLRTEEAALQYLSNKLAYLYLPVGSRVALNIERNLAGEEESSYPDWSQVTLQVPPHADGPVAAFLRPVGLRSLRRHHRAILLARGTSPTLDAMAAELGYAHGLRADFYPGSPGLRGFVEQKNLVMAPVVGALAEGRPVTLTGHSLGGAWATYAMGALSSEQQQRARLITYSAPGVDHDTARRIDAPPHSVRLVRDRFDFIPRAGPCHPRGEVLVPPFVTPPGERRSPHCSAPLAVQELLGQNILHERRIDWWHDNWTSLEGPRWVVAKAVGDWLPA